MSDDVQHDMDTLAAKANKATRELTDVRARNKELAEQLREALGLLGRIQWVKDAKWNLSEPEYDAIKDFLDRHKS